jgi:DNA-binding transcriptional LysR family regulator
VRLDIRTAPTKTIFDDLHEERLDAGIAIESDPDRVPGGLVYDRLTDAQMALITHPKHALARSRRAVDVGRLVAEPIIMPHASECNRSTTIWTYLLTTRQIYRMNGVSSLVRGVF